VIALTPAANVASVDAYWRSVWGRMIAIMSVATVPPASHTALTATLSACAHRRTRIDPIPATTK
jgi:hypothetical protein